MSDDQALSRPIGWWLKEADAQLDRAFERAFEQALDRAADHGRRTWQVLSTLAAGPATAGDVIAGLAAFDSSDAVRAVLDDLRSRGEVVDEAGTLRLTAVGKRTHQALAPLAGTVRRRVSAALPEQDYRTLVVLLARLVEGLGDGPPARLGDGSSDDPGDGSTAGPADELTER